VDDSEYFSSQDLESFLSISTQLVEISDEEMEDETDLSSQIEELPLPPDYTFLSGLKLSPLWQSIFLYVFLCVCEGVRFIWQTLQNPQYMGTILCDQIGLGKTGLYPSL
jgi:hypothetical protein